MRASLLLIALSAAMYWPASHLAPAAPATRTTTPNGVVTSFAQRRSHNGLYSAEVVSTSPLEVGVAQSLTVHLSRRAHRVSHASVIATAWMPETADSSATRPTVSYVGGGDYRIDDLRFTKPGWWNVALVIAGSRGTDSVAFNLILPARLAR